MPSDKLRRIAGLVDRMSKEADEAKRHLEAAEAMIAIGKLAEWINSCQQLIAELEGYHPESVLPDEVQDAVSLWLDQTVGPDDLLFYKEFVLHTYDGYGELCYIQHGEDAEWDRSPEMRDKYVQTLDEIQKSGRLSVPFSRVSFGQMLVKIHGEHGSIFHVRLNRWEDEDDEA